MYADRTFVTVSTDKVTDVRIARNNVITDLSSHYIKNYDDIRLLDAFIHIPRTGKFEIKVCILMPRLLWASWPYF